jgi:hypothetical protein
LCFYHTKNNKTTSFYSGGQSKFIYLFLFSLKKWEKIYLHFATTTSKGTNPKQPRREKSNIYKIKYVAALRDSTRFRRLLLFFPLPFFLSSCAGKLGRGDFSIRLLYIYIYMKYTRRAGRVADLSAICFHVTMIILTLTPT